MGAPVKFTLYPHYFDIAREKRKVIHDRPLGFGKNGVMRGIAKQHNTPCVVATENGVPVGWCIITPAGAWRRSKKMRSIQTFVAIEHRRRGIGALLVRGALAGWGKSREKFAVYSTRRAVRFYRAAVGPKNLLYKSGT